MKLKDLQKYYDKLQLEYGSPDLDSIYNGSAKLILIFALFL